MSSAAQRPTVVYSRNKRFSVRITRGISTDDKLVDRLRWKEGEKWVGTTITVDPKQPLKADRQAKRIVDELSTKNGTSKELTGKDARIYQLAIAEAEGSKAPLDVLVRDYVACLKTLKNTGITPIEACRKIASAKKLPTVLISKAVDSLLASLKRQGRTQAYIVTLQTRLVKFAREFPKDYLHDVTTKNFEEWLFLQNFSPRTHNNYVGDLSRLGSFAMEKKRGWLLENPFKEAEKKKALPEEIKFYTVSEVQTILNHTPDWLIPFVTLQLFGCLRSEEVRRAEWKKHVDLKRKVIAVSADIAKVSQRRLIEMPDNLVSFLEPWKRSEGLVCLGMTRTKILYSLKKALPDGFTWISNGLRKTCTTYMVPHEESLSRVSDLCGNSPRMLKANYLGLVSKEESSAFWRIRATSAMEKRA